MTSDAPERNVRPHVVRRRVKPVRTLAFVLVLELLVGAVIWFSHSPLGSAAGQRRSAVHARTTSQAATSAATADPAPAAAIKKADCPKPTKKPSTRSALAEDLLPIGILIVVITVVLMAAAEGRARPHVGVSAAPPPQLAAARPDVFVPLLRPLQHQVSSKASG